MSQGLPLPARERILGTRSQERPEPAEFSGVGNGLGSGCSECSDVAVEGRERGDGHAAQEPARGTDLAKVAS
jgi:hypothetical protein